jgi:hypothetical protein
MNRIDKLLSFAGLTRRPAPSSAPAPTVSQAPGDIIGDAPVTIRLSQLDDMRAQVRMANEHASKLEGELAQARTLDPTGRVENLTELARDLITIARFAVANLPPIEIRKWPWAALEMVANGLQHLPDYSDDDSVLKGELMAFAADVREHELDRSRKQAKEIEDAPPALVEKRRRLLEK